MQVLAYTWNMPTSGDAGFCIYYGLPVTNIAEYDVANQSLKLGVTASVYASATANGSMFVDNAVAQSTGWVTATLCWYIRGRSGGGAMPGSAFGYWITVKFTVHDVTADAVMETVLLHIESPWLDYGTWHENNINIPLYAYHHYRFSLFAEAHIHIFGLGGGFVDIGGVDLPDSRVEWGYLDVPNTERAPSLFIHTSSGGTTNPAPGMHYYNVGEPAVVEAFPSSGYSFDCWHLGNEAIYGNPITITMNSDYSLTAFFKSGGGGECPTLFAWNGTDYVDEGLLGIHAESDITVQQEIQTSLALENGGYSLQLRELDNYTSHIDQVKLYAVDNQGELHLCPLTYAYHSSIGGVTWKLRFDDSTRVDLEPTQTIDLKFLPSIPHSETEYFIFEINGYNRKLLR